MVVLRSALSVGLFFFSCMGVAAILELDQYTATVMQENGFAKAAEQQIEGARALLKQADLLYSPTLSAEIEGLKDQSAPPFGVTYNEILRRHLNTQIESELPAGFKTKVFSAIAGTYMQHSQFDTQSLAFKTWDTQVGAELSVSLWRNLWGAAVKAQYALKKNEQERVSRQARGDQLDLKIHAQTAYWGLAFARAKVAIHEQYTARAQDLYQSSYQRAQLNLTDQSSLNQAQAALEAARFELQAAKDEEARAARVFNQLRTISLPVVSERLAEVNWALIEQFSVPQERPGVRVDVHVADADRQWKQASADAVYQHYTPVVDLYAQYISSSRDQKNPSVVEKQYKDWRGSPSVGARVSVPLDVFGARSVRAGAQSLRLAAEHQYHQKILDQDQDWAQLYRCLNEAKNRLKLTKRVIAAEEKKVLDERKFLKQGRSTLFQVIQFEQQLLAAKLKRLEIGWSMITLYCHRQLYVAPVAPADSTSGEVT
jgi:outer membrane protein TolC